MAGGKGSLDRESLPKPSGSQGNCGKKEPDLERSVKVKACHRKAGSKWCWPVGEYQKGTDRHCPQREERRKRSVKSRHSICTLSGRTITDRLLGLPKG